MNVALWIVAGLLAAVFLAAGLMKSSQPKEKLVEAGLAWTQDFSLPAVRLIGAVEVLGAVGLILPALVSVAPVLVPIAATGLAVVMVGAIVTHARRREPQLILMNVVLLAMAGFVAWGRFGTYAF